MADDVKRAELPFASATDVDGVWALYIDGVPYEIQDRFDSQGFERIADAINNAHLCRTQQALHPALQQLYERYDLAMKRVRESGLDKRPYWSGEATGLEIAINLLGGTTDDR